MIDRLQIQLTDIGVFAGLAVVFTVLKCITAPLPCSLRIAIVNVVVAIPIGILTGGTALELGYGDFVSMTIASVATFLSRELLDFLRDRQAIKDLSIRAANNLVDKVTK